MVFCISSHVNILCMSLILMTQYYTDTTINVIVISLLFSFCKFHSKFTFIIDLIKHLPAETSFTILCALLAGCLLPSSSSTDLSDLSSLIAYTDQRRQPLTIQCCKTPHTKRSTKLMYTMTIFQVK